MQFSGGETPLEKQAGLFEAPKAGTGPGLGTSSSSATATAPPPQQPKCPSAEETKASIQKSYPWLTFRTLTHGSATASMPCTWWQRPADLGPPAGWAWQRPVTLNDLLLATRFFPSTRSISSTFRFRSQHASLQMVLLDSLYGTERGLSVSSELRGEISELISQLEAANPDDNPNEASCPGPCTVSSPAQACQQISSYTRETRYTCGPGSTGTTETACQARAMAAKRVVCTQPAYVHCRPAGNVRPPCAADGQAVGGVGAGDRQQIKVLTH